MGLLTTIFVGIFVMIILLIIIYITFIVFQKAGVFNNKNSTAFAIALIPSVPVMYNGMFQAIIAV